MNKNNAHLYLPLVEALSKGRTIQISFKGGRWEDCESLAFGLNPEEYRIKPMELLQPPPPLKLHNPNNLTAEQVGEGYRLLCDKEVSGKKQGLKSDYFTSWGEWVNGFWHWDSSSTIRVPASVPWPKVEEYIPLEPKDVDWNMIFRYKNGDERRIVQRCERGVFLGVLDSFYTWTTLMDGWEMKLPDCCVWEPCKKLK